MNIERPTSNVEWEKMKKQTYDLEKRPFDHLDKLGIFNRLTALSGVEGLKRNTNSKQM